MPARDFAAVYERLKPWLPVHVRDILDIGCGYAEIDVFLAKHYLAMNYQVAVHLLDGEDADLANRKTRKRYSNNPKPWRSRFRGVDTLKASVPECVVYDYPADSSLTIPCDLLISTRSWGHHYPIALYLGLADRSVRPGGRIITDIRYGIEQGKEIGGLQSIGFRVLSENIELHSQKCVRLVFER